MKIYFSLFSFFFFLLCNITTAQIAGCTDPLANNFNPSATQNDGSCTYNEASVLPTASFNLSEDVKETSGLITWNNELWTINDSYDINIYALDSLNGNITQVIPLTVAINRDWEEISQDNDYVYIGDFGNNETGNRQNLQILRIEKNSLLGNMPIIETIYFSYADQTDFTPAGVNITDFDCEAFVVSKDSIFLFTKQWISKKTSVYSIPTMPGTFIARLNSTYNVGGLITGATLLPSSNLIALSGYSESLQPFIYLLYDYKSTDYFGGNKRKISVSLPFHPVGGIATSDGLKYYISNEKFVQTTYNINIPQKLHTLNLSNFLEGYMSNVVSVPEAQVSSLISIFPNPAKDYITFKSDNFSLPVTYRIINTSGITVVSGIMTQKKLRVDISKLCPGMYKVIIGNENIQAFKMMKN